MHIFLTSNLGASEKIDGVRYVTKLDNTNGFVDVFQKVTTGGKNFVFVASDPITFEGNDSYARLTFDSFNMSGFNFENLIVLDGRNSGSAEEIIASATVVLLAGGHTPTQNKFFRDLGLAEMLKKHEPIVIGQSAGSLNCADEVYCSPEDEEELSAPRYFSGLGLTQINIEPHFENSPHHDDWKFLLPILLEDSKKKPFIAITDGSFIYDNGTSPTVYGEAYLFARGAYKQICQKAHSKVLTSELCQEK